MKESDTPADRVPLRTADVEGAQPPPGGEGISPVPAAAAIISVIIPALNEEQQLPFTLAQLTERAGMEVIVADGDSSDRTREVARAAGALVVQTSAGRARQMNEGARKATGSIFLFLHADTRLPDRFDDLIRMTIDSGVCGGAFELRIDATNRSFRWIERLVRWRSRLLKLPYGDQAMFMTADVFHALGGFPELPIMEDFEMARRLRRAGRFAIIPAPAVTSARRWLRGGVWRTTLRNQIIIAGHKLGISPSRLARWRR